MVDNKDLSELFNCIQKSVQTIGAKNTSNILKNSSNKKDKNTVIINFIIKIVIEDFAGAFHSQNEIFKRHIRGDASTCRNMIIVLISKCTILSSRQISSQLKNVSGDTIRNVIAQYNNLDRGNKIDKKIIDRHEILLEKVLKFTNK